MKRIFCFILCFCLLATALSVTVSADEGKKIYRARKNDHPEGDGVYVCACDSASGWSASTGKVTYDTKEYLEGDGCVSWQFDVAARSNANLSLAGKFDAVDLSQMDTLEFDLYLSDPSVVDATFQFTAVLSSSGDGASNTASWLYAMTNYTYVEGWNHISLDFSDASYGNFNSTAANYFRLYFHTVNPTEDLKGVVVKIDNIIASTQGTYAVLLDSCEEMNWTAWNGSGALDETNHYEGCACLTWDCTPVSAGGDGNLIVQRVYDKPVNAEGATYLEMDVYLSDAAAVQREDNSKYSIQVEITSSGTCDHQEYTWSFFDYPMSNGWNHLRFPISSARTCDGAPNMKAINYCRFHMLSLNKASNDLLTFKVDNIYLSIPVKTQPEKPEDPENPENPENPDDPQNPENPDDPGKQPGEDTPGEDDPKEPVVDPAEGELRKQKTFTRARILLLLIIFNIIAVDIIVVQLRKQKQRKEE